MSKRRRGKRPRKPNSTPPVAPKPPTAPEAPLIHGITDGFRATSEAITIKPTEITAPWVAVGGEPLLSEGHQVAVRGLRPDELTAIVTEATSGGATLEVDTAESPAPPDEGEAVKLRERIAAVRGDRTARLHLALQRQGWTVVPVGDSMIPGGAEFVRAYPPGFDLRSGEPRFPYLALPARVDTDRQAANLTEALQAIGPFESPDEGRQ